MCPSRCATILILVLGGFQPVRSETPAIIYWQCNDVFTAFLNGMKIEPQAVTEAVRPLRVWKYETALKPGHVLGFAVGNTTGAYHVTAAAFSEGRLLFGSGTGRWVTVSREPPSAWWTSPAGPDDQAAVPAMAPPMERNVRRFS